MADLRGVKLSVHELQQLLDAGEGVVGLRAVLLEPLGKILRAYSVVKVETGVGLRWGMR